MGDELLLPGVQGLARRYLNIRPEGTTYGDRIGALKEQITKRGFDRIPDMDALGLRTLKNWLEEELGV